MIKVTIGTNTDRSSVIVEPNRTLRSILDEKEIDYTRGTLHLDGASLKPGDLDKTFTTLGIIEKCYLISVVKADGAA